MKMWLKPNLDFEGIDVYLSKKKQIKRQFESAACLWVTEGLLYDLFPALDEVKIFLDWLTAVGS